MPDPNAQLAATMWSLLLPFENEPAVKRLRIRLRDVGEESADEVERFRQFQKACREHKPLNEAFRSAGFGDVATLNLHPVGPQVGAIVQAFSELVDRYYLQRSGRPPRS